MKNLNLFNINEACLQAILERLKVKLRESDSLSRWVERLQAAATDVESKKLLREFDRLYVGNGIAYLINPKGDSAYKRQGASYLNMGETYTPTLCYFHKWGVFRYVSWGDALEMMENYHD